MAAEPVLSQELKRLLDSVKANLVAEFPIQVITPNYLVLSVLDTHDCDGYSVVSKLMLESSIEEFRRFVTDRILKDSSESVQQNGSPRFSDEYDRIVEELSSSGHQTITSSLMLYSIVTSDDELLRFLVSNGVTKDQLYDVVVAYSNSIAFKKEKSHERKKAKRKQARHTETEDRPGVQAGSGVPARVARVRVVPEESNAVESASVNLVREAEDGKFANIVGFEDTIDVIFSVLGKYDRSVVAITGDHGVGKTSVVYKMADMMYRQDCPRQFTDKYIMKFDDVISVKIIAEMDKIGKYIAFIDDVEKFFINKDVIQTNMYLLSELFKKPNVSTILTMTDAFYAKYIETAPSFSRYVQRIQLEEPSDTALKDIVRVAVTPCGNFNSVKFSDDAIDEGIRLAKRFVVAEKCPKSAVNILDMAGSCARTHEPVSDRMRSVMDRLDKISEEKMSIQNSGSAQDFDRKDSLIREEIALNAEMSRIMKSESSEEDWVDVSDNDVRKAASMMFNVPVSDISSDDRERLKSLKERLCCEVIGQDDAVDEVCRSVRRQRVGVSDPNKPVVLMFVGSSGVGKTFLAKRLAYEVFGDESNMVRLDMSEYSDVTSVTKLYGASAGYVGYDEGGVLTEALKKKPRCVLLLDEIEKAHDDVFNVFLQVFDDGRLSDNKGNTVSFRNVIVIMTSNVGTKDVSEKVATIGFGARDTDSEDRDIIMKSIKRKFKPEFINRIDNICFFRKLTDDNLRVIITHEIQKTEKRLNEMGYSLDSSITEGEFVDQVFEAVRNDSEYGARPVQREVRRRLDDRVTDLIIEKGVEKGYVFTAEDIQ